MKRLIVMCILFSSKVSVADYCIFDGSQRKRCFSSLVACNDVLKNIRAGMSRNDECRQIKEQNNFPKKMKATEPNAYCIWAFHANDFKNMGCMEKQTCEYAMTQFADSVCVKGSVANISEIKKIYLAHNQKVKTEKLAADKKKEKLEKDLFSRGDESEIINHIKTKFGALKITKQEQVKEAQQKIEPFCEKGNPKACLLLSEMYGLSSFKAEWNISAQIQCEDLKKSIEYLNKSCLLGLNESCQAVISKDDIIDGRQSNNQFIWEPGQKALGAGEEPKGVKCNVPDAAPEVYKMKERCAELGRLEELCK